MTNDYLILFDDDVIDDSNDVNDEDDGGHYDGQNDVYQMHVDDVVEVYFVIDSLWQRLPLTMLMMMTIHLNHSERPDFVY